MKPVVDVVIVTYPNDLEWFKHSIVVLQKNLSGFRDILVVVRHKDVSVFEPVIAGKTNIKIVPVDDWPEINGYYWQQWVKMNADKYTDADIILHMDSDVFYKEPVTVDDFLLNGKPAWLWCWYTDFAPDGFMPWQKPTEDATKLTCPKEYCQAMPFILRRETYALARDHIAKVHGIPCDQYIKQSSFISKFNFSEWNAMGRIANELTLDSYTWVDRNREEWPKGYKAVRLFWSHAPIATHMGEINQMISGGTEQHPITNDRGIWILSNDTHISKWVEQTHRLDFDTPTLARHCKFIKPGDTVVDVGAYIGDNTLAYARATAGVATGHVIAFEPNPAAFECLKRNMTGFSHVQCEHKGLSDTPGQMSLVTDPNAGATHLANGLGIPVARLDDWKLPRLAFLKIDAEGMELKVLRGAEKTIRRCRPVMYIEINRAALIRAGTTPDEVRSWLHFAGYEISGWAGDAVPLYDITCKPY